METGDKKRDRTCLKELSRGRLLREMVKGVTRRKEDQTSICAMVIDKRALKVLSASCKAYDMIEDGVVVWEGLEKARQPLPELDVIYFLDPTKESLEHLVNDFPSDKRPKYRNVHIFFTSAISNAFDMANEEEIPINPIMMIAEGKSLVPRIKSLVELNLAFVAYEKRVFHLDMPESLPYFYHPHNLKNPAQLQSLFGKVADRLATLFATFGDIPTIRYHSGHQHVRLCENLAQQLHVRVARFKDGGKFTRQATSIFVIDRSFDLGPVLMHGTTFQSQLYDVLDIGVCSLPEKESNTTKKNELPKKRRLDDVFSKNIIMDGVDKEKDYFLDDSNELYARMRHKEAIEVSGALNRELQNYLQESKTHKMRNQTELNNQDMINGLRGLPQYRAVCDDFQNLINLASLLINEFKANVGPKIVSFEHALATGLTEEGKEFKKGILASMISESMGDQLLPQEQKARLALLYIAFMRNMTPQQVNVLIDTGTIGSHYHRLAKKFLECQLHSEISQQTNDIFRQFGGIDQKDDKKNERKDGVHHHKVEDDKEKLDRTKKWVKAATSTTYYKPEVRTLLEDMVNERVPIATFPYIAQPDHIHASVGYRVHADATGLKAKNKNWDFSAYGDGQAQTQTQQTKAADETGTRKKLVLFVIGGLTFTEMAQVYELAATTQIDLYIGSTSIYTPRSFFEALDRGIPDDRSTASTT